MGDQVGEDLGIRRRLEQGAVLLELPAKRGAIGESARQRNGQLAAAVPREHQPITTFETVGQIDVPVHLANGSGAPQRLELWARQRLVHQQIAVLRERLEIADVPAPFRGSSIALITAGILSLAFMGFTGFARL